MTMYFKSRQAMRDANMKGGKKTDFGTNSPAGRRWGVVYPTSRN